MPVFNRPITQSWSRLIIEEPKHIDRTETRMGPRQTPVASQRSLIGMLSCVFLTFLAYGAPPTADAVDNAELIEAMASDAGLSSYGPTCGRARERPLGCCLLSTPTFFLAALFAYDIT